MTQVVEIQNTDDPRDVIHQAVHLLADGKLVGFPMETEYVVAGHSLQAEAVEKLQSAGTGGERLPTLALKSADEALDYIPGMSALGRKLARRCWPGPVTLDFEVDPREGLLTELPARTRASIIVDRHVQLRVPAHRWLSEALWLTPAPLVISAESSPGTAVAQSANDLVARFGEAVAMVVDDGTAHYAQPSTLVRVRDNDWNMQEAGVIAETALRRMASEVYVFVCTGNTCRSPMAEGLFRKLLAERLQCSESELADRGFIVASAGVSATVGAPANPEAVSTMDKLGVDLRTHQSYPLTGRLLEQADYLFTMTRSHRELILMDRPDLADRVAVLAQDECDIPDPFGGGPEDYEYCRQEIERHVRAVIAKISIN